MTLKELADIVVKANREGTTGALLDAHYHADCVSVEATPMPGMDSPESVGLDAIRGKHAWWESNMESVEDEVSGPYLHGDDRFAVFFNSLVREKATGNEIPMEEVGVYTVADGKIVREEFFYTMDG